jgi:predicted GTPase
VISGDAAAVRGRRCVVVGDGPTLTHGGMAFGAGTLFVRAHGGTIVDPRPHLVGSLRATLEQYPHVALEIPAMGYAPQQVRDLEASVNAVPADVVVDGSPADLARVVRFARPVVDVRYELDAGSEAQLAQALAASVPRAFTPRG